MNIRKAEAKDIQGLEKLFLNIRRQTFTWENPNKFLLEDYKKFTEGETVFLAEGDEGQILGFISVLERESPPFIHHLFVSRRNQRKGVGTALINSLLSWLEPPYHLKCLTRNWRALAFYLKNHWFAIGEGICEDGEFILLEFRKEEEPPSAL